VLFALYGVVQFKTAQNEWCILILTVAFSIIASGNNVFGVLKSKPLNFLGDICYSTYLLHGLLLFVLFYFVISFDESKALSEFHYCLIIIGMTPLLVIISFLSFKYIEKPAMNFAQKRKSS
jgi:peptidoglycan/LPS O-acetylase OafA/YrhL